MINLELYKLFVIVANEGNITKASKILHISQPAITKQIHNLEFELNTTLFERSNTGMRLTVEGNKLYFKIKDAIELISNVEKDFKNNRTIHLGTRNKILSKFFSKGITNFYNAYPEETIDIKMYEIDEMLNQLNNGIFDIVLSKRIDDKKYSNVKFISLGTLHDVFVTKYSSKHSQKEYSLEELKKMIIYTNNVKSKAVTTLVLRKIFNVDDLSSCKNIKPLTTGSMIEILKNEDAIGFTTKEFIEEELKEKKLDIVKTSFDIPTTEYGIYYNKNNSFNSLDHLIECIKNTCTS